MYFTPHGKWKVRHENVEKTGNKKVQFFTKLEIEWKRLEQDERYDGKEDDEAKKLVRTFLIIICVERQTQFKWKGKLNVMSRIINISFKLGR